jgi:Ca-activated chloride channel family protein
MSWLNWSWLTSFHHGFAYPAALWLMVVLLLLSVADLFVRRRRRQALAWLGSLPVLRTLVAEQALLRRLRASSAALGLSLLVTGIAGPQWGRDWEQPAAPGRDLVVVLDLSRSMLAEAPNRLERAKTALLDLVDTVQRRGGHRLALVVFAGRARVVCPLTHDYDHFRDALSQLDGNDPRPDLAPAADSPSGTRIGEALVLALDLRDPRYQGAQDLLLLSDGDDPAHDEEWRSGAEEARAQHVPVHTVGVGSTQPSPIPVKDGYQLYKGEPVTTRLDEKPLQEVARLTEGTYTAEHGGPLALGTLFRERIEPRGSREDSDDNLPVYRQHYAWFLGPALALLALEMALGWPARKGNGPRAAPADSVRGSTRQERRTGQRQKKKTGVVAFVLLPVVSLAALIRARSPRTESAGHCLVLAVLAAVLVGAAPARAPEDLVRQGNAAFQREDYGTAVERYAAAEDRITDPGLVAFNEAAALYRQAAQLENTPRRTSLYREAELHYRRCLEDATGTRRAEALYGLGNSLLQQVAHRGAEACQEAVRAYGQCLAAEAVAADLAADARHNLELAKLLALQAKTNKKEQNSDSEEDNNDPTKPRPNRPDRGDGGSAEQAAGTPNASGDKSRVQVQPGQQPIKTDDTRPPGEGNLPPVEDRDQLVPMAPEDAAAHLERAAAQVLRERHQHQHLATRPPSGNVKDW